MRIRTSLFARHDSTTLDRAAVGAASTGATERPRAAGCRPLDPAVRAVPGEVTRRPGATGIRLLALEEGPC